MDKLQQFPELGTELDMSGAIPFHYLCSNPAVDVALIDAYIDLCPISVGIRDESNRIPLVNLCLNLEAVTTDMLIAYLRHRQSWRQDLESGSKRDLRVPEEPTPLLLACQDGKWREVEILLLNRALDLDAAGPGGITPLMAASYNGFTSIVASLLTSSMRKDGGVSVDMMNEDGATALWLASEANAKEIVTLLLSHGSDPNRKCVEGTTALWVAAQEGHLDVCRLLVASGAQVDCPGDHGSTPLWLSAQMGHEYVLEYLIVQGARVDIPDQDGETPLMISILQLHPRVAKLLIDNHALVDIPRNDGAQALHLATEGGEVGLVTYLLRHGAEVDAVDNHGFTALHIAVLQDLGDCVAVLLAAGASTELKTTLATGDVAVVGMTALDIAREHSFISIVHQIHKAREDDEKSPRRRSLSSDL